MVLAYWMVRKQNLGIIKPQIRWTLTSTLWLFNIAMENGPFIDYFPIKTSIYKGFSMAMLNNQMVLPMAAFGLF
jgi:hypothetical protein